MIVTRRTVIRGGGYHLDPLVRKALALAHAKLTADPSPDVISIRLDVTSAKVSYSRRHAVVLTFTTRGPE